MLKNKWKKGKSEVCTTTSESESDDLLVQHFGTASAAAGEEGVAANGRQTR